MATEPLIAFVVEEPESPGLEIRVNFGVFAGREVTPAELEELAASLLPAVGEVSIVSEERHEIGPHAEATLHQVRVDLAQEQVPPSEDDRAELATRLVELAEEWALRCIAERHGQEAPL